MTHPKSTLDHLRRMPNGLAIRVRLEYLPGEHIGIIHRAGVVSDPTLGVLVPGVGTYSAAAVVEVLGVLAIIDPSDERQLMIMTDTYEREYLVVNRIKAMQAAVRAIAQQQEFPTAAEMPEPIALGTAVLCGDDVENLAVRVLRGSDMAWFWRGEHRGWCDLPRPVRLATDEERGA